MFLTGNLEGTGLVTSPSTEKCVCGADATVRHLLIKNNDRPMVLVPNFPLPGLNTPGVLPKP